MNIPPEREEALFEAVLALPPEKRVGYLDQACAGNAPLRQRVEALLQAHEQAGHFMTEPAAPPPGPTVHLSLPLTEKPGDKISHYKLLQQIGEGGCGVVYMAEQEEPIRRRVAFKVIKLGMDTKQVIARFEAERQALALMDHPNIAKVLDAGATEKGRPYFVMELVRGIKITDYCDQNNLPTEARLELFMQVCHAIQHAHQKGIIHRDIKPSNILVTVNDGVPVPKVIDFGIAKATEQRLTDKTLFTAFEQFIGTPAYMSPEQAEMTSLDIDTRSDIYALGVLLYELLTGQTPFDAKALVAAGLDEMRRIIREQEPARPSTRISTLDDVERTTVAQRRHVEPPKLIHQVRGELDWIVMKCLEKDRTRRYEAANGLALDIEHHLKNEPVTAAAPGAVYLAQKFVRRHQVGLAMAAALVFLLVAGVVVSTWQAVRATRAEKQARAEATKSGQVARFLKDMLEGVGPSVALGRDTTMLREILDKTVERVSKDLKDQPEVEAELFSSIGNVYRELALYDKAEAIQNKALALRRKALGNVHADVADSLNNLSLVFLAQGKLAKAESTQRDALTMRLETRGQAHQDVADSLNTMGLILWQRGKLAEAETFQRQAQALLRKLLGNEDVRVASSLNNLSLILHEQGKLDESESTQREALTLQRKLLGNEHPDVALSINNLGSLLWKTGQLPEAESMYREVLVMQRKLLGGEHPSVAVSLNNLGTVLRDEGRLVEAAAVHREALAMQKKLVGVDNPAYAGFLNNLGRVFRDQGRLAEAEAAHREALALRRKVLNLEHPAVASTLDQLALVLSDQGRLPEAEKLNREALALRRRIRGDMHPDTALSLEHLAALLLAQQQPADAEPLARECLAIRERKLPNDWRTFSTRCLLGGILSGQKKYAEADALLISGYEGMTQRQERIPAEDKPRLREAVEWLVRLYEATDRPNQAAEWKQKLAEFEKAATGWDPSAPGSGSPKTNAVERLP